MANAVRFSYTGKPRKTNLFFWVFYKHFSLLVFKAFLYSSNAAAAPSLRFSSKKEQAASFQRCARPFRFPMTKSNIPPCFPALRRFPHRSNFHQKKGVIHPLFDPGVTPVAPLFRNFIKRNERFPFIFTPGIFSI